MKPRDIFKDIFRLAVRLAGLFFLCVGLKDLLVQTYISLTQLRGAGPVTILTTFLPVVFTLAVAVWLLRGNWLIRLAYPEADKTTESTPAPAEQEVPQSKPAASQRLSDMEMAEEKLAALVARPKCNLAA